MGQREEENACYEGDPEIQDGSKMFKTLKAAREAGFRDVEDRDYGGEWIDLKGHTMVRNTRSAKCEADWRYYRYTVKRQEKPHSYTRIYVRNRLWIDIGLYREDQVRPLRRYWNVPLKEVPILLAVWAINRSAKRYRDFSSKQYSRHNHNFARFGSQTKKKLYHLKDQTLHYLVEEGVLQVKGYHRFDAGWAEVLKGEEFTFHRPCRKPEVDNEEDVPQIEEIEAKTRERGEPKLKDAVFTLENYLEHRPEVEVYRWTESDALVVDEQEEWEVEDIGSTFYDQSSYNDWLEEQNNAQYYGDDYDYH